MHLIACIDERDGLSFCGRRLSSDRALSEYLLRMTADHRLWVHPDARKLFPAHTVDVAEDFTTACKAGDYCFVEQNAAQISKDDLESVTLCCWNRRYPFTEVFPRGLLSDMRLSFTEDFPGNSHACITVERYTL